MWPECNEQGAKQSDMRLGVEGKRRADHIETCQPRDWGLYPVIVKRPLLNFEQSVMTRFAC